MNRTTPIGMLFHFRLTMLLMTMLLMIVATCSSTLSADVIWIKGESNPIFGLIEEVKTDSIVMRVVKTNTSEIEFGTGQTFLKSNIDQWIANVDPTRLEKLSPENIVEYRNYAEELASQKLDPVASNLARRLYLIAATDESLQTSSLAGLHSLASSQDEKTRIEMLQFMLRPTKSLGKLGEANPKKPRRSDEELALTLELVQSIRRQKSDIAISLLRNPENRQAFAAWDQHCSIEELDQIASANQPSKSQLSKLLRIELDVIRMQNGDLVDEPENARVVDQLGWGDWAVRTSSLPSVVPGLDNISEFDSRESIYRNGIWVRPPAD